MSLIDFIDFLSDFLSLRKFSLCLSLDDFFSFLSLGDDFVLSFGETSIESDLLWETSLESDLGLLWETSLELDLFLSLGETSLELDLFLSLGETSLELDLFLSLGLFSFIVGVMDFFLFLEGDYARSYNVSYLV